MKDTGGHRGLRIACLLLGAAAAADAGCSATPLSGGRAGAGGGTSGAGGGTLGAGGVVGPVSDAAMDVASTQPPDADPSLPPDMVAAAPPEVACTGSADAGVECDLPPSTCALPAGCDADLATCMLYSGWIVYYENGRCVAGRCVWDQRYFQCENTSRCTQGACMSILLTT
jgi:hypothetical protein